ncbi:peptidoglycan DD-metalloendopeptidase family protein [Paraglaciecola sp.]|uniref:peptidoglycan DD-metalloendopeptidase family protein n=1 Tax=Paraglaciecola sp. TaxID=1920173 RepID=UPI0030F45E4A
MVLFSCSNRKQPAPVIEIYQGKTFRDFEPESFSGNNYTVLKGDTLFSIAWFSGNDYQDLARTNKIAAPYNIYPGQIISLKKSTPQVVTTNNNNRGQTSKIKSNQAVDPPSKQAYGKSEEIVKKDSSESSFGEFPNQVSNWLWPTSSAVSRGFSAKEEGNKGLDFAGNIGSSILAAADGKVVYTGNALRGFGNLVIIKHSDAYLTAYAHNDQILVKEQQWIKAGQQIATMGKSGTDQVKLHFEVRYKGKSIDPLKFLPKR